MKRTPRVLAAVVAATALTFTGVHTADAKPDRAGTHAKAEKSAKTEKAAKAKSGKGAMSKLDRDKARVEAQIDKATSEKRLEKLEQAHKDAVLLNVVADKTALADVGTRADLRQFRVENYRLAVNVLRKAAKLGAAAEKADVDVTTYLPVDVLAAVAAINAQTPKADAKPALAAARAALSATAELLDPEGGDDTADDAPDTSEGDESGTDGPEESQLDEGGSDLEDGNETTTS